MPANKKRRVNRKAAPKGAAVPHLADPLANALGEAAWAEADLALAAAMAEFEDVEGALRAADAHRALDALAMGQQALNRVARKRSITRFGDIGETAAFDPARHQLDDSGQALKQVKIIRAGLERGGAVLVKARVAPVRAVRKART